MIWNLKKKRSILKTIIFRYLVHERVDIHTFMHLLNVYKKLQCFLPEPRWRTHSTKLQTDVRNICYIPTLNDRSICVHEFTPICAAAENVSQNSHFIFFKYG
jgi:hypothetical protein